MKKMPKTTGQSIFSTAITAWMMVYVMTVYNTVLAQVFFASFIALVHTHGYNVDFVPNYIMAYIRNFVMALPVQLFIVGPLARLIFRSIFCRVK